MEQGSIDHIVHLLEMVLKDPRLNNGGLSLI